MKLVTYNGSIYELDLGGRRIRRLEGATPRWKGEGTEWIDYHAVSVPAIGAPLRVTWRDFDREGLWPDHLTSPVLHLEQNEEDSLFLSRMADSLKQSPEAC